MADAPQVQVFPFGSKGLFLKEDPSQLQQGQFQQLSNVISIQEGTISVRNGDQRLTNSSSYDGDAIAYINAISSLTGNNNVPARYLGATNGKIYRSIAAIPGTGANMPFTPVATGIGTLPYTDINFNGGNTGKAYAYFACEENMLKDDGFTFNPLEKWGIIPPSIPAVADYGAVTILPSAQIIATSTRFSGTATSYTGTAPGLLTIQYTASTGQLVEGMEVTMGFGFVAIVQNPTATQFQAYCLGTPTGPNTIVSGYETLSPTTTISASINASFGGTAANGYSTNDLLHIALATNNPTGLNGITVQVNVNNSNSDYYQASVAPSSIQPTVTGTTTATQQLETLLPLINLNVYGPYNISYDLAQQLRAYELAPVSPVVSPTNITWTEIDIPKSQFIDVGLAGTTDFTWANVTGFTISYTVASGASVTVWASSLYFHGGYGPNGLSTSATTPLLPYDYVYCYQNPVTGTISNPSPLMIAANAITPQQQQIAVTITGTGDAQVAGMGSVVVYRRGGSFSDGYFRQVGYVTNPGAGVTAVFYDSSTDESIDGADTALFDNDPPVTSSLPTPVIQNVTGITGSNPSSITSGTVNLAKITVGHSVFTAAMTGSVVTFSGGTNIEQTVVEGVISGTQIWCYIQYIHAVGEQIEIDAITGQPCNLGCSAFNSIFLAGDVNNPNTLYQSKIGRPEAFPVVNLESGVSLQITVGDPADGIVAVTEFDGQVVCLNMSHIYVIPIFAGVMESPQKTPAERGLIYKNAFCKTDNELWYMSYDGIYSWAGGASVKRSEQIDPLFKGYTIGTYAPIDLENAASSVTFAFYQNEIRVTYIDGNGFGNMLRYNMIHDRWSTDDTFDNQDLTYQVPITAQYCEVSTGNMFRAKVVGSNSYLYLEDNQATSDGWVNSTSDGAFITFGVTPASYMLGSASLQKQFSDIILDQDNDGTTLSIAAYYDYSSTPDSIDQFTISPGSNQGRRRIVQSLQNGFGKEAYTMTLSYSGTTTAALVLYSITFNYIQLTQVQVGRAYDWDDLGYPHDKLLYQLIVTYDIPSGQSTNIIMDTMTGIEGNQTITQAVATFTLTPPAGTFTGPSHLTSSFPLPNDTIAKRVRIRPQLQSSYLFKIWGYTFDKVNYPADVTLFTDYSDFGWPCEKIARNLILVMNTGGVACSVALIADGSLMQTFSVTSTIDNRIPMVLACNSNLIGRLWKLEFTPGSGGQSQLFSWSLDYVKEPCAVTYYDSYETDMGYQGWKWLYQGWIHYASTAAITLNFYVEDDTGFFSITLPQQTYRDMQRFYFPAINGATLNKSRIYRMTITCSGTFKLYADSRIEYGLVASDRRQSFRQFSLTAEQQNIVQSPLIAKGTI